MAEGYLYVMRDRNVTGSVIDTNGGCLLTSQSGLGKGRLERGIDGDVKSVSRQ